MPVSKQFVCGVGVAGLLALAAGASAVPVTSWSFDGASLQHVRNDDGTFWAPYDTTGNPDLDADVTGQAFGNGMKLFSSTENNRTFRVDANSYIPTPTEPVTGEVFRGNRLVMSGTATIDGTQWDHPDDTIRTHFFFGFGFSGGTAEIYKVGTSFLVANANGDFLTGVGSGTGFGPITEPGGYGYEFNFVDRFGADISTGVTIYWSVEIYFDWAGYNDADDFQFFIPENSIDLIAERVPAPSAAGLLAFAGLAASRRRR
ncbi:MAG: hypothetical protein J0L61_05620 [Planctomycetes bacterium]|nr:hypothetical protein [Planctomycetota bacterium]